MKYTIVDGSGNSYKLQNATLTYSPMTPELSSSGTYSGGEPFTLKLEKIEMIRIIDVFERALWFEGDHEETRTMGSGTLYKNVGEESKQIYLSFRSDSMEEINKVLGGLKPNP